MSANATVLLLSVQLTNIFSAVPGEVIPSRVFWRKNVQELLECISYSTDVLCDMLRDISHVIITRLTLPSRRNTGHWVHLSTAEVGQPDTHKHACRQIKTFKNWYSRQFKTKPLLHAYRQTTCKLRMLKNINKNRKYQQQHQLLDVTKIFPPLACYNFDRYDPIFSQNC